METLQVIIATAMIIIIFIVMILAVYFFQPGLWLRARLSGVEFRFMELASMRWREAPVSEIVDGVIKLTREGLPADRDKLEAHAQAGGSVPNVVNGLIAAKNAGLEFSFEKAAVADLRGIEVKQLVKLAERKGITRKNDIDKH